VAAEVLEADLERASGGLKQLRRRDGVDLVARVESVEVRDVTMAGLDLGKLPVPLEQLAPRADLQRRQMREHVLPALSALSVDTEYRGRLGRMGQRVPGKLHVHRRRDSDGDREAVTAADEAVLR